MNEEVTVIAVIPPDDDKLRFLEVTLLEGLRIFRVVDEQRFDLEMAICDGEEVECYLLFQAVLSPLS